MKIFQLNDYSNTCNELRHIKTSDSNNRIQTNKTNQIDDNFEDMNINRKYTIHQGTNQLIIRIYDSVDNKIIKEIPSEEILDIKAKIFHYIGLLFDKRI